MSPSVRWVRRGLAAVLLTTLTAAAPAQDQARRSTAKCAVQMDNAQVRVCECQLKVGERTPMQAWPARVLVPLTPCHVKLTFADGKIRVQDAQPGKAVWADAATFSVENIGMNDLRVLAVELKHPLALTAAEDIAQDIATILDAAHKQGTDRQGKADQPRHGRWRHAWHRHAWHHGGKAVMLTPSELHWSKEKSPLVPAGAEIAVLEGNPDEFGPFALRVKLPAGFQMPAHWHHVSPQVTVLSGTLNVGAGEKADHAQGKAYPAGSFVHLSGRQPHFVWTDLETVLQVQGFGPWRIRYVNPADNPQKTSAR